MVSQNKRPPTVLDQPDTQTTTPSQKCVRGSNKKAVGTVEKKKRLSSCAITAITPVSLESSSENDPEGEMDGDKTLVDFPAKKQSVIGVSDLEKLLDKKFAVLVTSKQVDQMSARIEKNESDIQDIRKSIDDLHNKFEAGRSASEPRTPLKRMDRPRRNSLIGPGRELSFTISRRSLRMWPIKGNNEDEMSAAYLNFIRNALRIPEKEADSMKVERIRRTRTSPNAPAYLEACVTFRDPDDRDYVASKSVNLAMQRDKEGKPLAVIRMDVLGFLLSTFKALNNYAYIVRKRHGKDAKTYIKFDDPELNLFLEVKLPGSERWLRISPDLARESNIEWTSNKLRELQRDIRTRDSVNLIPLGTRSSTGQADSNRSQSVTQGSLLSWIPPRTEDDQPDRRLDHEPELDENESESRTDYTEEERQIDDSNNEIGRRLNNDNRTEKKFNFAVTNARSLAPKAESLVDSFN